MKKVGIATMTGGANYGNALQNYAVQEVIRSLGYAPYTLQNHTKAGFFSAAKPPMPLYRKLAPSYVKAYRQTRLNERYGCKNTRDCRGRGLRNAKRLHPQYLEAKKRRREKFDAFRQEYLSFDPVPMDAFRFPKEHLNEFYAFVCGSDQVWNPYYYTNSMIEFLQFAPRHKRIAFAPSFGISQIPESRTYDYTQWLQEMDHLSVREQAGADIIQSLCGKEAKVLLDPTFGLTKEQWLQFGKKPANAPAGDYVFCYFLGDAVNKYCRWIEGYAKKRGYQVVELFDIHSLDYYDIDPCEFVWLLSNAKAVFTDSFHGAAFSVNLQKPFVAFDRQEGGASMSSRIRTLLKKTGLEERTFPLPSEDAVETLDFSAAIQSVEEGRRAMFDYLGKALEQVAQGREPLLANRYHCTGCGVCANVCPVGALTMEPDPEGFLYPRIDSEKCTRCGACQRVCPADSPALAQQDPPKAIYAFGKDASIVEGSSSGGVFTELANVILEEGGVVFGVGYDQNFRVEHQQIQSKEELYRLRTSKYVQSNTGMIYSEVKRCLGKGKQVLFTGTSCQIAALQQYLGKDYENLFTADIICHGVPSPGVWETYLKQCHGGKEIKAISFRDKTLGWNRFSMRVSYADGSAYCKEATKDPFERGFLANLYLRPSCYQCQYKTLKRSSDLTLADYWGVETVHPELKAQEGVSLVLLQSEKGKRLFSRISSRLNWGDTDREKAISMNHGALHSVKWNQQRRRFYEEYPTTPMAQLVEKCLALPLDKKVRRFVIINGSRVKQCIRKIRRK